MYPHRVKVKVRVRAKIRNRARVRAQCLTLLADNLTLTLGHSALPY